MKETLSAHGCRGRGRIAQVIERGGLDLVVHLDLLGGARAGPVQCPPRLRRLLCALGPVEYGMVALGVQIAGQLRPEAVQLVGTVEVLFTGQDDIVPDGSEPVCPGDRVGRKGRGVVPGADVVDVPPGHKGHAGGRTERRVAVGVLEDDAIGGEAIQVGGLNQRMTVGAAEHGRVLIGHDEQQVGPVIGSHGRVYLPASRLAQYTYAGCRLRTLPVTAAGRRVVDDQRCGAGPALAKTILPPSIFKFRDSLPSCRT